MPKRERDIEVTVYASGEYSVDRPINLVFEVSNRSKNPLYLLKWGTPLEGFKTDCLEISRNGKRIPFGGKQTVRSVPSPMDFVFIPPGRSRTRKIDIARGYSFLQKGRYRIGLRKKSVECLLVKPTLPVIARAYTVGTTAKHSSAKSGKGNCVSRLSINVKGAHFLVVPLTKAPVNKRIPKTSQPEKGKTGATPVKSTNRQAVAALVSEQVLPATGILRPCSIQGGTATQQAAVNDAHDNGYILASQALKGLQNDARYQLWFGVYLPARFNKVQAKLQAIVRGFEETDFVYIIDDNACDPGAIACTNPGDPRINICTTFFSRPPAGTNSMAGRVLHEHSHSSADTLDVRYGQAACQALAATRPDDAANNADSYEFYAGG